MKHKKLASLVLAGAMILGLAGTAVPALAAGGNTTSTTLLLAVAPNNYEITIPATMTVNNSGWNAIPDGIKAEGSSFDTGKKLTVTATSEHNWNLYLDETHKIGYTLKAAQSDAEATTSWTFTAAELNASGGKTVAAGINVNDYSSAAPGTYQDVVTFTATVTNETYTVTVNTATNGTVSASSTSAAAGAEVTLTVTPDSGYELDTLTVKDASNGDVAVTDNKFTMPASNVTVTATFKAVAQLNKVTITGNFTGNTLEIEFSDGQTWGDIVANYPNDLTPNTNTSWVAFGTDGFVKIDTTKVKLTDQIDPTKTYTAG